MSIYVRYVRGVKMKNRLLEPKKPRRKNGRFWCSHVWEPVGKYGPDWDLRIGVRILCRCAVCRKLKHFHNTSIKEIPDELIDTRIKYT